MCVSLRRLKLWISSLVQAWFLHASCFMHVATTCSLQPCHKMRPGGASITPSPFLYFHELFSNTPLSPFVSKLFSSASLLHSFATPLLFSSLPSCLSVLARSTLFRLEMLYLSQKHFNNCFELCWLHQNVLDLSFLFTFLSKAVATTGDHTNKKIPTSAMQTQWPLLCKSIIPLVH